MLVGEFGEIIQTEDGGKTWVRLNSGTRESLTDVYFNKPDTITVVGNDGLILHSTDHGQT